MAREVSILIRARNAMAAGLKSVEADLQKFGAAVKNVGAFFAKAFAAIGGAMLGAFTVAGRAAENFNKQMSQVATISDINMETARAAVMRLSAELGATKEELTKGLYDALSAGVPKENALTFLATAARAAKAGAATTAQSVDFLTTALNAFKIPAGQAEKVADTLFTTVRLGKTTVSQLAASFSVVGPIAAASGVAFEQVMAAAATLTKQGVPTAQAMTQIRSAIVAMNETLGDGWSRSMTLQEGFALMAQKANGSQVALKEMTGRVEAMGAILGTTGNNAAMAADDLRQVVNGVGEMGQAFSKVAGVNPFEQLRESINNVVIAAGDAALKELGPYIEKAAQAAQNFAARIKEWADAGGMVNAIATFRFFFEEIRFGFERSKESSAVAWAALSDGVESVINYAGGIMDAWIGGLKAQFEYLRDLFAAIWAKMKDPFAEWDPPDFGPVIDKARDLRDAFGGWDTVTTRTVAAMAAQEDNAKKHAENMAAISKWQLEKLSEIGKKQADATAATPEPIAIAAAVEQQTQEAGRSLEDWQREHDQLVKQIADAEMQASDEARQRAIDNLEEQIAKREEMASKAIADIKAEGEADKQRARDWEAATERAARLRRREGVGARLSKDDQAWLAAFDKVKAAREGLPELKGQLEAAKGAFDAEKKARADEPIAAARKRLDELKGEGASRADAERRVSAAVANAKQQAADAQEGIDALRRRAYNANVESLSVLKSILEKIKPGGMA